MWSSTCNCFVELFFYRFYIVVTKRSAPFLYTALSKTTYFGTNPFRPVTFQTAVLLRQGEECCSFVCALYLPTRSMGHHQQKFFRASLTPSRRYLNRLRLRRQDLLQELRPVCHFLRCSFVAFRALSFLHIKIS